MNSMTGFGKGDFTLALATEGEEEEDLREGFAVEVKSLNHRYLDINLRAPERFYHFEVKLREAVKKKFSRGAFTFYIKSQGRASGAFKLNLPLIRAYLDAEKELKDRFALEGKVDLSSVLRIKDIFTAGAVDEDRDAERDWVDFKAGLDLALEGLAVMRETEGATLKSDIEARLGTLERFLDEIEKRVPEVVDRMIEKLKAQVTELLGEGYDETRIISESVMFADKTNVTEEVVRFRSHTAQMRRYLVMDEPIGRRLDFLCQELLREANTIGSKSPDVPISQAVIEIKGELEKIREQVQNIE